MSNQRLLFVFLFVAGILGNILVTQAQQLTPECYVTVEDNRYTIHFTLPQYDLENEDGNDYDTGLNYGEYGSCDYFTNIIMDEDADNDMTDVPGYPELPFFSINLILPDDAHNIQVTHNTFTTTQDYPSYYIAPAQMGSYITNRGNGDSCTIQDLECYNSQYYSEGYDALYPNGFYTDAYSISPIYSMAGTTGITFSIFPFSYYPHLGYMDVLLEGDFYIEYEGSELSTALDDLDLREDYLAVAAKTHYTNYNNTPLSYAYNGNYLIVAAHENMEETLDPYIYYKTLQGYNVDVVYLDACSAIGNSMMIDNIIHSYNDFVPDFVLLVGSMADIPPHWGSNIPSDELYYPLIGRWVVKSIDSNYTDLANIIEKTIYSETAYSPSNTSASLFSGVDDRSRWMSKKFYRRMQRVVDESFGYLGIPYSLQDGRSNYVSFTSMKQNLQSHPSFFIYGGHGTKIVNSSNSTLASGIAKPYKIIPNGYSVLSYNHIGDLNNTYPYPMGFGFACSLNTYAVDDSFGADWVSSSDGGVSFYGATTVSYTSSNDWLSKRMFRYFRKMTTQIGNFPLSLWVLCAEINYFFSFPTPQRLFQITKYNLIGDPTLYVYGMSYYGSMHTPSLSPRRTNTDIVTDGQNLLYSDIFNIDGLFVKRISAEDNTGDYQLPKGIYIKKDMYSDDTFKTTKLIY